MAPKKVKAKAPPKKGGKTAAEPLELPKVSAEDLAKAQETLKDKDARRRANSNMQYWLGVQGKKETYASMDGKEKKDFFRAFHAASVRDGQGTLVSKQVSGTEVKKNRKAFWLAKHGMIQRYGEEKAVSKIAVLSEEPDRHRADKDTGKDDEWSREFKLYEDEEDDAEIDQTMHELSGQKDLQNQEEKKEALEDMQGYRAGNSNSGGAASGSDFADPGSTDRNNVKIEGAAENEDLKTFKAIQDNPKKVLTSIGNTIAEIKSMIAVTNMPENVKHSEVVRTDLSKLLPKLKTDFNNVEKVFVAKNDAPIEDPQVLAIARKVDANFEFYSDAADWYNRICKPKRPKKN
jgi:hypothetical protein